MPNLAPTLQGGIAYEQPVSSPNLLGEIAGLAGTFASAITKQGKQSESSLKGEALTPFAQKIEDLKGSNLSDAEFQRQVRTLSRKQLTATPQYSADIKRITGDIYGVQEEVLEQPIEDTLTIQRQEYLETPEGSFDLQRSITLNDDGTVNEQDTASKFNQFHMESLAEQAAIERSSRQLELAQNDVNLWKTQSEANMAQFLPSWTKKSQGIVDSLITQAAAGAIEVDTPEEQLAYLRQARRALVDSYRSKAQAANIHPDIYSAQVTEAIAPIDNLIETAQNMGQDQEMLMNAFRNAQRFRADQMLTEALGPLGVNTEFQRQAFASLGAQFYNEDTFRKTMNGMVTISEEGRFDGLDFIPNVPSQEADSVAMGSSNSSAVNPEVVSEMRRKQDEDGSYFDTSLSTSLILIETANPNDPQGRSEIFSNFGRISALAESTSNVLGKGYLDSIFSEKNIRMYASATQGNDQAAVDLKNSIAYFSAKQVRRNQSLISRRLEAMSSDNDTWGVKQRGNTLVVTRNGREVPMPTNISGLGGNEAGVFRAVQNINKINSAMSRIEGVSEEINTSIFTPSVEEGGEDIQRYLNSLEGQGGEDELGGSQGADLLVGLIDRTEGGGDYDTLFGFSNREGRTFSDVNVSSMTLGELSDFSQGEYADWSKGELGYVATPMGKYQIVGTTLRQTMKEMGLPENIVFTPKVQDAMFHHIARKALRGKDSAASKRKALRATWEGFKNVEDSELDAAIAQFEGSEAPSLADIQSVPANVLAATRQSVRPEARPSDFTPGVAREQQGTAVQAQRAPTESETKTSGTQGAKTTEASKEASQRVWSQLENQTKMMLVRLFGDEEAALKAISDGEISEEDLK